MPVVRFNGEYENRKELLASLVFRASYKKKPRLFRARLDVEAIGSTVFGWAGRRSLQ
jgi:hypothetical protein